MPINSQESKFKNTWLCLLACFLLPILVIAQTPSDPLPKAQPSPILIEPLLKMALQLIKSEKFDEAYAKARLALELSQRRGAQKREARAANLLAISALATGRVSEAIQYFKRAAALVDETAPDDDFQKIQVTALSRAGGLLRVSGQYADALYCYSQALQLYRQRSNYLGQAVTLSKISAVYSDTGDSIEAVQQLQTALALAQRMHHRELEESLLMRLSIVEKERGNFAESLQSGQQAFALEPLRPSTIPGSLQLMTRIELLYHLGTVHAALDQQEQALDFYQKALTVAQSSRTPQIKAFILGDLAWTKLKSGDASAAVDAAAQSIKIFRQTGGNKHFEAKYLFILALAQEALGSLSEALLNYRQSIATLEQARSVSIPTEISRAGIVATRHQVFAGVIDFLLRQQLAKEALEVAEAYHARAFLDVLAETGVESFQELSLEDKVQETALFAQISSIQKDLWKSGLKPEEEQKLKHQQEEAETGLENFRLQLRRANPHYADVKYPTLIKPDRIAQDLLAPETAMIEFVVSEKKSFAWVIYRDKIASVVLPPGKEIEELMTAYRESFSGKVQSLTARQAIARQKTGSQQLYQKLFQPLEAHLSGARKLIIVPDGVLAYLPFESLVQDLKDSSNYLIERFAISYAPSASALAALRVIKQPISAAPKGFFALGDPLYITAPSVTTQLTSRQGAELRQLPYTRGEVNEIAALFSPMDCRVFLGAEAHEKNVKTADLSHYRYLHFAAHGLIDEDHPARSGLMFSSLPDTDEDGLLQMPEIMRLKLNADLVTLSACRTGLGKLMKGEGMIGLTRSFLYAGAKSVMVSLWNVNDLTTAMLMKNFYHHLQQGMPKDEALRQAKLQLLKGPRRNWQHPYYWASFILVGDPK